MEKFVAKTGFFFGEKPLLVPTFLDDFHFSPYILFLLLLVPILKNASCFVPAVILETEIAQLVNGMHCWPDVAIKIIIKNATSAFKLKKLIY